MQTTNSTPRNRGETVVVITFLMLGALWLYHITTRATENNERFSRALTAHIKARQCVVADIKGRAPSLYVCQLPVANEYVEAGVLGTEARARQPGAGG